MYKKKPDKEPEFPVFWFETSDSVCRRFQFEPDGQLSVRFRFHYSLSFSHSLCTELGLDKDLRICLPFILRLRKDNVVICLYILGLGVYKSTTNISY